MEFVAAVKQLPSSSCGFFSTFSTPRLPAISLSTFTPLLPSSLSTQLRDQGKRIQIEKKSKWVSPKINCSSKRGEFTEGNVIVKEKSVSVILLAGGKGTRMGANMPKQYLPLLGQPIALYRGTLQGVEGDARLKIPVYFSTKGHTMRVMRVLGVCHICSLPLFFIIQITEAKTFIWNTESVFIISRVLSSLQFKESLT